MLLLARSLVARGYVNDTVSVDVEGYLDLRNSSGSCGDAVEVEATEGRIVCSHLTLALKNVDLNACLGISSCGEDLALLYGNCGVSVDDPCEYAAESLKTEREGSYVEKEDVLDCSAENAALNCRTEGNAFVGVDALEGLLAEELLNCLLNCGDPCGAAYEKDLVDLACFCSTLS